MESYEGNNNSCRGGSLRVFNLLERRRLAPLSFNSGGGGDGDDNDAIVARKLLYRKLPQQRNFKLSVLKLDGSLFDVNVGRNATVAELKVAIEELFAALPGETHGSISWSHVWGHFCLSYEGQKLVNNKACIRNFGIKDGDQLQFIRHMSVNQSPLRRRLKHHSVPCKWLSSGSSYHQEKQQKAVDYNNKDENQEDSSTSNHYEEEEEIPLPEVKLAHLLRGWLSCNRLWGASRKGPEGPSNPPRFTLQCLGG
ncbi:uncharacterized protein LOC110427202 isoform X1 [Herrania umbratica]|uniref:Uncharacterized protein LOC110427202 isoform X1 n=1 Tax=Herrania umbratica TaxID=108875 RepID=A0A6J1BFY1_9ROSI|nr:uncharacterized protein LOC110427202 isoform X1 [Herrania umbratica]